MRFLALALFVAVALASETPFNSHFWNLKGRAAPSQVHSVVFGVKLIDNAAAICDSALLERSLPQSSKYGQHMSFKQVGDMFRNPAAERRTLQWLRSAGISAREMRMTPNGEFVRVTTTVAKLEKLLPGAQYQEYTAVENSQHSILRDLSYRLPQQVKKFVDFVSDTYVLPVPPSIANRAVYISKPSKGRQSSNTSPQLLWSFYNVTQTTVRSAKATQSLFESLGQSFVPSDLTAFQQQYNLQQTAVSNVVGTNSPSSCSDPDNCAEASLDVQYILALAQNASTTFWSVPGNGDIFLTWIEAVAATSNPPLIHSLSYGSLAPEDPQFDVERFNTEMCKLGLKGLTLFVASGDDGVANFGARGNPSQCGFTPSFPATSPYATAVGATQGPEAGTPEIACSSATNGLITTGGGFSTYVKRPDWQDAAVHAYLNGPNNVPPRSMFSSQGRAYPDVAMLGHNYPTFIGGQAYILSGTSASTPVMAGMFNVINGNRLARGKSALGWLNPTIYQLGGNNSAIFNDITSGVNNCCAGEPGQQTCCQYGFQAASAWDPLTGWGSVNWKLLNAYFSNI